MAWAYRARFQSDFLIDLIGYRRYGHNEGDEPAFTQPLMYQKIARASDGARAVGGTRSRRPPAARRRRATAGRPAHARCSSRSTTQLKPEEAIVNPIPEPPPPGAARQIRTAVAIDATSQAMNEALLTRPEGFTRSPQARSRRANGARRIFDNHDERSIDWATAEELAFATILADGIPIRLTGEDVAARHVQPPPRGVPRRRDRGAVDIPLQRLPQATASFEIHNSPLSENATIGFEYGYNVQAPERLVIWEGAVRRLHQRRAGDHRRVRHLGPRQVGPDAVAGAAVAARLRRPGTGPFERPAGALPRVRRRHQPARRQLHDGGAVLPPAAPAGAAARPPTRCR